MLSGVCIGTNDMAKAAGFYDAVFATIGMTPAFKGDHERGYAEADGRVTVFVVTPYNNKPATFGNGTQFIFHAPDKDGVHAFHSAALNNGGTDEGAPGPRDYHPDYYGAYVRDPDGNKLHISISLTDT